MATISANLKMTLPESFDKVDIAVLSNNFALIDEKMVTTDRVANNLGTEEEGKALDARQGKALNDRLAKYENIMEPTDDGINLNGKYIDNALFR